MPSVLRPHPATVTNQTNELRNTARVEFAAQDARSRERNHPIGCEHAASRSVTYARFDLGRGRDPPEGAR